MPPKNELEKYKKEKLENHILSTPDTYIGGCDLIQENVAVYENDMIQMKEIEWIQGLGNIFNEILVNARDQIIRLEQSKSENPVTSIKITMNQETGEISIMNDGEGIDIADHPTEKDKKGNPLNIVFMIIS